MEITPQDLGEKWRRELLKRRAILRIRQRMGYIGANESLTFAPKSSKRRTRMARFWLKGANLPEGDARAVVPLLSYQNTGVSVWRNLAATFSYTLFLWFASILISSMLGSMVFSDRWGDSYGTLITGLSLLAPAIWALWAIQATLFLPRSALRQINRDAVTTEEIESFLPIARGDLDRTYLNTILETLQQPLPVVAGQDIRKSLRAIGDVLSVLPGQSFAPTAADPVALRQSALAKRHQADTESDTLLQESLCRQAEAEEKQAQIVDLAGSAIRRAQAQQGEAHSQLDTLRTVLAVYASPQNAVALQENDIIQDSLRQITQDAVAVAGAKRELDDSELAAMYGGPIPEPAMQHVGSASPVSPPPPGKWWQGANGNSTP